MAPGVLMRLEAKRLRTHRHCFLLSAPLLACSDREAG
jgi:hypothetical protein